MANAYSGFAAVLKVEIAAVYTAIAAVRDISGPAFKTNAIDTSSRTSRARTFVPGSYDGGEVTFDIVYDPDADSHAAGVAGGLVKLMLDGTQCNFRLEFPDTSPAKATFSGFVTGFTPKAPMDDALTADVTIKVAGLVSWS